MKNILWILRDIPCAGGFSAGNLRLYNLLSYLAQTKQFNINVRGISANYGMGDLQRLDIDANYNQDIKKVIDLNFKPDIIIVSWYNVLINLYDFLRNNYKNVPIVCDTVDVNFSRLESEGDNLAKIEKQKELDIYKKADRVFAVCENDQNKLKQYGIDSDVISCCYKYDDRIVDYNRIEHKSLSFQGYFLHRPNIDAAFKTLKIFKELSRIEPLSKLYIAGKNPPSSLIDVAKRVKNAHVCGVVYDFDRFMQKNHVSVAPLTYNSGQNGKILDNFNRGIPIVASTIVKDGIPELKHEQNILLFDIINIEEFAKGIAKIFNDKELRLHLIANGKKLIKEKYSIKVVGSNLLNFLNNI